MTEQQIERANSIKKAIAQLQANPMLVYLKDSKGSRVDFELEVEYHDSNNWIKKRVQIGKQVNNPPSAVDEKISDRLLEDINEALERYERSVRKQIKELQTEFDKL